MGYIGVITHLLTIDPNFLGHLSTPTLYGKSANFGPQHGLTPQEVDTVEVTETKDP